MWIGTERRRKATLGLVHLCFCLRPGPESDTVTDVERPGKFEEFQWVGDKRTLVVYDVDAMTDESIINELMEAGTYASFGPDTVVEARNRGYRPFNGTGSD